jgi:hypothetical protein
LAVPSLGEAKASLACFTYNKNKATFLSGTPPFSLNLLLSFICQQICVVFNLPTNSGRLTFAKNFPFTLYTSSLIEQTCFKQDLNVFICVDKKKLNEHLYSINHSCRKSPCKRYFAQAPLFSILLT